MCRWRKGPFMTVPDLAPEQLEELHRDLLADRLRLEQYLERTKEGAQPVDLGTPIGRLSRMDAMQQQEMTKASRSVKGGAKLDHDGGGKLDHLAAGRSV